MLIKTRHTIRLANLRILIAEAETKAELARRTGVNQAYLSQIEKSDGDALRNIGDDIARRLETGMGKPLEWMDQDHNGANEGNVGTSDIPPPRMVRVISWLQAGRHGEAMSLDFDEEDATVVYADASIGAEAFALRVRGDSMVDPGGKSYPDGCLIVVDPGRAAKPGDRIVVRLATAEAAVFKQLEFDGAQYFLKPLNPRYPIQPMPADAKIVGVVVMTLIQE